MLSHDALLHQHMKSFALLSAKKQKFEPETAESPPNSKSPLEQPDRCAHLLLRLRYDPHRCIFGDEGLNWFYLEGQN